VSRTATALRLGLREYARTPVLLALFAFLPVYFVAVFASVAPSTLVPVHLPGGGTVTRATADAVVVLVAPIVTALVVGITGLFVLRATADADSRLVIAGYDVRSVVFARFGVLAVVALVETIVTVAVALAFVSPDHLGGFALGILLAGATYGAVGVAVGVVLDRLSGVYVMLFGPTLDVFLFQNPMTGSTSDVAALLPGHYASELVVAGAFAGDLPVESLGWGLVYLLGVGVVAGWAFVRSARPA